MRYRLLQARLPGDVVITEERDAFAARLSCDPANIEVFDCLTRGYDARRVADGVDAVLVGGSAAFSVTDALADAPWLRDFYDTLAGLAADRVPTFASCFGFQAFVVALGGEVVRDKAMEQIGSSLCAPTPEASADPVFRELPPSFRAQMGHQDSATRLPSGTTLLATSKTCPYQAVRVGDGLVWATQFHPELTHTGNLLRFDRYWDMYVRKLGLEQAQALRDTFLPSPEATDLLGRFARALATR